MDNKHTNMFQVIVNFTLLRFVLVQLFFSVCVQIKIPTQNGSKITVLNSKFKVKLMTN